MAGAAKKVFGAYVHVPKKDGTSEAFAPGDAVPSWASKLVGDHVLAKPVAEPEQPPVAPAAPAAPTSTDGGTPDDEAALAEVKAKLEEIGQPTDGDLEALQKRLAEHGE